MTTVGELIEKLKAFDLSTPVVVAGFDENGYDDVSEPKIVLNIVKVRDRPSHAPMYVANPQHHTPLGAPFNAVFINF